MRTEKALEIVICRERLFIFEFLHRQFIIEVRMKIYSYTGSFQKIKEHFQLIFEPLNL